MDIDPDDASKLYEKLEQLRQGKSTQMEIANGVLS